MSRFIHSTVGAHATEEVIKQYVKEQGKKTDTLQGKLF